VIGLGLKRANLHSYQQRALAFIKDKRKCALFLDMGLGKSVIALTAASDMLDDFLINKVLVVAPLRVSNTVWKQEAKKWEHLKHLNISIATGSAKNRIQNLQTPADIHVINRENVDWLVRTQKWQWDMIIIDESSSFKSMK
jgi:superfamily II DNA or RNA helicase